MNRDKLLSVIAELELEDEKSKKLLEEVYELVDDYNEFVKHMDKRFDRIVSGLEQDQDE